jgi:hypothetical protein
LAAGDGESRPQPQTPIPVRREQAGQAGQARRDRGRLMRERKRGILLAVAAVAGVVAAVAGAASCRLGRSASEAMASNVCYECHIDFRAEELVVVHETHGVTCVRCHGPSRPHMEDEERKTPADATFRAKAMGVFCLTCHKEARNPN